MRASVIRLCLVLLFSSIKAELFIELDHIASLTISTAPMTPYVGKVFIAMQTQSREDSKHTLPGFKYLLLIYHLLNT